MSKPLKTSKFDDILKSRARGAVADSQVPVKPTAKSKDLAFRQVSAWVKRDTYDAITIRLVQEGRREFSNLVQSLLEQYLTTSAGKK